MNNFFQKTWVITLLLFIFPPLGIFLLWKHKKMNVILRTIISVIFILAFIGFIFTPTGNKPQEVAKENNNTNIEISTNSNISINESKTNENESSNINTSQATENNVTSSNLTKELSVHFIDVGQADSIFIDYDDYDILIDAGNNSDGNLVVNYLKNLGVDDIEILVATHPHEDHIGGLDNVLAAYEVETVIDSGMNYDSKTYNDYWNAVVNENTAYKEDDNLIINISEGIEFKILEMGDGYKDTNDNSVVCLLDYNDTEFLFMGDLEAEVENKNLSKFNDIDVLKLGHHGSNTSTSKEFLNIVKPEYGIISCGKDNKYGHPHAETLTKLKDANVKMFRTDKQGTIIATTDGSKIDFNFEPLIIEIQEQAINNLNSSSNTQSITTNFTDKSDTDKNFTYMGNSNSKKLHYTSCTYAKKTGEKNRVYFKTREDAINAGYIPCKKCQP